MTAGAERYARAQELFQDAADLSLAERNALLDQHCAEDSELRREVEALLAADPDADGFMEKPIAAIPSDLFPENPAERLAGQRFGPYEVIREIGRGGLGTVYLAKRADDEYHKEVALKLVRRGLDTEDVVRRFRNERQILAQLDHPNIARLLDGGTSDDERPFFVMEHVRGEPLIRFCETHRLSLARRLELFRKVCAAVSYAHQNLVIHRDLKPSNILVTEEGAPKLLDFGIAKLLTPENELMTQTVPALRVMTPEYASPEQIKGGAITTSSDVYSLGVLLYELLTGQKPYRLTSRTTEEISRAIPEQAPRRPSDHQQSEISNQKSLRGDLDNIILMALRKEPERRYPSVEHFSEDIRRHLAGLPVIAHKDTLGYRSGKFLQRHKTGALAAALVLLTIVAGVFAVARQARIAAAQRDQAQIEKANAERVSAFLQKVLLLTDPSWVGGTRGGRRGREVTVDQLLRIASEQARTELSDQPAVLAGVLRSIGTTYRARGEYGEAETSLREARAILLRVAAEKSWETMTVTYYLAQCLFQMGHFPEAHALFHEVLPFVREQADPSDDQQILLLAGILNDYASLLRLEGEAGRAEELLREALQFAPRWQGATRAIVGIHLGNLGQTLDDQGDLEQAEKTERAALAELRGLPGGDRVELARVLFYLGGILTTKGELAEAATVIEEGLAIYQRLLGDLHPYNARGKTLLAALRDAQADYAAAERLAREALAIQEAKLPPEDVSVGETLTILGRALTHSERATEAEPVLRRALGLRAKALPQGDFRVAQSQLALAECLAAQGQSAEAQKLMAEGQAALAASLGASHPSTIAATAALGRISGRD